MKYFLLCVTLLSAHQAQSECLPKDIPRSWLIREISLGEIHQANFSFCEAMEKRGVYLEGEQRPLKLECELESGNVFEHELKPGYKIYEFRSPKSCWEDLAGRAGYVLEIDGSLVESKTTSLNQKP